MLPGGSDLVVMNLHRFFLYVALIFNVFLWYGAIKSFWYNGQLGIGVGSVVLVVNAYLLMMYSLSCHSLRHLVGGRLNCFTCSAVDRARYKAWKQVSFWNLSHRKFAWTSLIWVAATDLYIRLVSWGVVPDLNTWSGL